MKAGLPGDDDDIRSEHTRGPVAKDYLTGFQAYLLLVNIGLGGGLAIGGICIYYLGIVTGSAITLCLFLLFLANNYYMNELIMDTGAYTYEDLAERIVNKRLAICVNVVNFLFQTVNSIAICYLAAISLQGFIAQLFINDYNSILASQIACVLYLCPYLLYFITKKRVKQLKYAAFLMNIVILLFTIIVIIYAFTQKKQIMQHHQDSNFAVRLLPTVGAIQVISKISVLSISISNTQSASTVIHGLRPLGKKVSFRVAFIALFVSFAFFMIISLTTAVTFGSLLLSYDSIVQALYKNSRSQFAALAQILFIVISLNHSTIYIFTARESALRFIEQACKCSRILPEEQEDDQLLLMRSSYRVKEQHVLPLMYERVKPWIFYLTSVVLWLVIIAVVMSLQDLITILELVDGPLVFFLASIFPNVLFLVYKGVRHSPLAVILLTFSILVELLMIVSAILDFVYK